jgi:DNA repair protein RadD
MNFHPIVQNSLRDFQLEGISALYDYFATTDGNPLLCYPTGTGKSYVNAGIAINVLTEFPNQRIIMLTHVKNLIEQNLEKLLKLWPNAPVGIYSAGLNQRDTAHPLIFGGVASVVNNVEAFGHRDLCIIDEAHLVSPQETSMYQDIIKRLRVINPMLKIIGLTATAFRCGQGMLTEGDNPIFDDICFDLTGVHPFNRFIAEGYLAPLIPKQTRVEVDTSSVKIINGDFAKNQLDEVTEKILYEALKETVERGYDRNCWLVFCSGIKTANHAAEILQSFGISAAAIHSKLSDAECDKRFEAFKRGELRAICGNNKFTTGFDFAPIDLIAMLRSTASPGLWVQMLGRGTRPYDFNNPEKYVKGFEYVKRNCLVLDYAGNCRRLGPINDVVLPRKKGDKTGDAPIKICDACGLYNHASARHCGGKPYPTDEGCGAEFLFKTKLVRTAGTDVLIAGDEPVVESFEVTRVIYHKHNKVGSMPSMKVSYYCGLQRFSEYVCLQHLGMAKTRARSWWQQRHASPPPETVDEALLYSSQLRCPKRISVVTSSKFPEIVSTEW